MRSDIAKLLVERPRHGSRDGKKSRRLVRRREARGDIESLPTKASLNRPYANWWSGKELSEYFPPILRFLRKAVGRPWSKVYSEIREHLNLNSTVQYHVIQHLRQWVNTSVVMRDGKPFVATTYSRYGEKALDEKGRIELEPLTRYRQSYDSFYVNPDTGILCQAPVAPQRKQPELPEGYRAVGGLKDDGSTKWGQRRPGTNPGKNLAQETRVLGGVPYMKRDGIWYAGDMVPLDREFGEVRLRKETVRVYNEETKKYEKVTKVVNDYGPGDIFLGPVGRASLTKAREFYGVNNPKHYCRGRGLQLSTKELARLGLQNG